MISSAVFSARFIMVRIVGEDRNIDMDIAIAGVHMGGDDNPPGTHLAVDALDNAADLAVAAQQFQQIGQQFFDIDLVAHRLPAAELKFFQGFPAQVVGLRDLRLEPVRVFNGLGGLQILDDALDELGLVMDILVDVVGIDETGELRQRRQGQDNVFVQLEGIGAGGNRSEPLAVAPEAGGLVGILGDEQLGVFMGRRSDQALPAAQHLGGGVADHVDEQHRLGCSLRRLELVFDGPDILLVEVLEGHQRLLAVVDELLGDLDDDPAGLVHVFAEEFQAEGHLFLVGLVEDEFAGGDDAVGALLLEAGQAASGPCW
jgi:hypothetical protein